MRGGAFTITSQFTQFALSTAGLMILGRLLSPEDYGLLGMVTPITGFLRIFRDAGLHTATVQRETITDELISTIFWINLGLGLTLSVLLIPLAPVLAAFYAEPKVYGITLALAVTFTLDAATAQHQALLRRAMRFKTQAKIDIFAMYAGVATAIAMALRGYGYWSLVGMPIAMSVAGAIVTWMTYPWCPGLPRRGTGAGSMMRFGGYLTGAGLLNYIFRNADNVMIGRYWGAAPLGLYQKAYGLLMLPISQVNSPISNVAVSALSRLQAEPDRQRRYFIGGYTVVVSIILPIVAGATIFAEDLIRFVLGPQWLEAVTIFQLLAPAALIGALLNPLGWLYVATGRADRQLRGAFAWCVLLVTAFAAGLKYGPEGVALAYTLMSAAVALPMCLYGLHGTSVRLGDLGLALLRPTGAIIITSALVWLLKPHLSADLPAAVRALGGCFGLVGVYAFVLLVGFRQWATYRDLLAHLRPERKKERAA